MSLDAMKQEPVAWQWLDTGTFRKSLPASAEPGAWRALYTTPPQRQPLTAKAIAATVLDHCYGAGSVTDDMIDETARAIERAHGIGGQNA